MSNRQYGNPSRPRHGSSPGYRGQYPPMDDQDSTQSHQLEDYGSPSRRPVAQIQRQDTGSSAYPGAPPPYQSDTSYTSYRSQSSNSPARNVYGAGAVGGGMTGIASNVAYDQPRESGMRAQQDVDNYYGGQNMMHSPYETPYQTDEPPRPPLHQSTYSQNSIAPLATHPAEIAGHPTRMQRSAMPGYGYGYDSSMPGGRQPYQGDGYDEYMDPGSIADDGEDYEEAPRHRKSRIPGALAGGAGAGAAMKAFGPRDASGNYGPVPGNGHGAEKSEWLKRETGGRRRRKWIIGIIAIVLIIAVALGIVFGVVLPNTGSGGPSRGSAGDTSDLWNLDSSEVQAVLNNKDLHRVFPGMDYTPLNAQYPDCLSNPPYQNDVTLDVAVLAQLTPAIRLYGTDCKQTELVLKAIDLLNYNTTMQVWLGVWLGTNQTTNTRQLNQMYTILDTYPTSHFAGIIVGNEVLFREDMTITALASELSKVKSNLAKRNIDLPVSTSDLGDDWTAALAADSDIVMANVHPFFAGVTPEKAAGWTWSFWQTHNVNLKTSTPGPWPANIISETGWPSEGGNNCGDGAKCPDKTSGSVAGIDELNTFMEGWVCPSLANGTTYFWFEAFDEPWKEIFNDPKTGDFWEPHWGLMDVDRKLKDGVKIPDCGGKTVNKPY